MCTTVFVFEHANQRMHSMKSVRFHFKTNSAINKVMHWCTFIDNITNSRILRTNIRKMSV